MDLPRDRWSWSTFNALALQEFQALIIDYERKAILLKKDEARWIMPAYADDVENWESSYCPEFVKEKICDVLGLGCKVSLCVLRQVWRETMKIEKDKVHYTAEKAVVLVRFYTPKEGFCEQRRDLTLNGHRGIYEWVSLADADVYHPIPDAQKVVAEEICGVLQDVVPKNRLRWHRPGWMESTIMWMEEVLGRRFGARVVKPLYVERSTPLGTVIIADTSEGKFFVKCTTPWQNDAVYTEAIARMAPKFVPMPVAVDASKQVMITKDYGEILNPSTFTSDEKSKMTRDFVALQQNVVGEVDELVHAGMPDFRLDALMTKLDEVVNLPALDLLLEREEYQKATVYFRNNVNTFKAKVEELYSTVLPATIIHNDLWCSNIFKDERHGNYMFFDWVEGCVAHPLAWFNNDGLDKKVYISEWEKYGNIKGLGDANLCGRTVGLLIEFILEATTVEKMEELERNEALKRIGDGVNDIESSFREYSG